MNVMDVINNRRSIRKYKKDDISDDVIIDIINCGHLAPSAKNRQPWKFVVAKGVVKDNIANLMIEYANNINEKEHYNALKCPSSVLSTAKVIKQAPVLILIFRELEDNWIVGDNLSIGGCVENMCLRATELNLGTLWIRDTVYVAHDISKLVNHENLELNCALLIGYPDEKPKMRPRNNINSILEWYR